MDTCSYSKLLPDDIESYDGAPNNIYPIKKETYTHAACNEGRHRCVKKWVKKLCKVISIIFAISFVVALLFGIKAYRAVSREVKEWTVTDPGKALPIVKVPEEELELFVDRAKLFYDTIKAGKVPSEDLVVSERTANGFAAGSHVLRGHAFAEMKTNEVKVSVSLPMDDFPGGKGRYLVGTETLVWYPEKSTLHTTMRDDDSGKIFYDLVLHLDHDDGELLRLEVVSGQLLHWTIPEDFIEEHNNLLDYDCDDSKCIHELLHGLDEISLENDQIVLHAKDVHDHRALAEKINHHDNKRSAWKFHLARKLVGI